MKIKFDLFPGHKKRAVTFSYDDGTKFDRLLVEKFDKYGAKCTFNLNSDRIGKGDAYLNEDAYHVDEKFVKEISERHEIACHAYTHPFMERLPLDMAVRETYRDRDYLENLIGKPVVGMAYPYGTYDQSVINALRACGIKYCRTTHATGGFGSQDDWLKLNPTCHHNGALALVDAFFNTKPWCNLPIFYIWGHSFEFDGQKNWNVMDELLSRLSERDDIWYATNIEIYDYMQAIKNLRVTADETAVYNPSAVTVYATAEDKPVELKPGFTRL